ncbi:MAG: class IV adenylate cyclase [Bacteroidota bacterium]
MSQNLELKLKLASHKEIRKTLRSIKAEFKGILRQKDIYYKTSGMLLKLRTVNGKHELIKYRRDESGADRWSDYELLFLEGENVETYFNDFFETECIVEKSRELWLYKDTRIHLDDVKYLGLFLELETVVKEDRRKAKELFDVIVSLLSLNLNDQILSSYKLLFLNK